MITTLDRNIWVLSLIWTSCYVLGAFSLATVKSYPPDVLDVLRKANGTEIRQILNNTRRIILGKEANTNRPYMVYLKLPSSNSKFSEYKRWLCGGVIVHEEYILTSAACIEDVKHFYVVSGTFKFSFTDDRYNNPCIKNGAKKAVWKCIPRNYVFDGHENDNVRWMNNDIAVVKLEDEFDFTRRVRGCDYTPRPICYNNQTTAHEEPGNRGSVAGWGSTEKYNDWVNSRKQGRDVDSQCLLEVPVTIMAKPQCKKRWGRRYQNIIDNYMICTSDMTDDLTEICQEKYVDCTDILTESDETDTRRGNPDEYGVHSAHHNYSIRRYEDRSRDGGFCENDHGGPLVIGEGVNSIVIGIISACLVKERTNKCYGPFLYTSIFKNRVLINCAIYKDVGQDCNKLFRASVTHTEVEMNWSDHPDGPAKSEIQALRRRKEEEDKKKLGSTEKAAVSTKAKDGKIVNTSADLEDSPLLHAGVVVRAREDEEDKKDAIIAMVRNAGVANKTTT